MGTYYTAQKLKGYTQEFASDERRAELPDIESPSQLINRFTIFDNSFYVN